MRALFKNTPPLAATALLCACGYIGDERLRDISDLETLDQALVDEVGIDELVRMSDYLKERVPLDAVTNSIDISGEPFDCVLMERQPSLERMRRAGIDVNPIVKEALKNLPQQEPEELAEKEEVPADVSGDAPSVVSRLPAPDIVCPVGTVPIRRVPLIELAQFGTLEAWLHRHSSPMAPPGIPTYEYAHVARSNTNSWGARADLNLWSPATESNDHSISQIWVTRGTGNSLETVEAGWKREGWDSSGKSRLFVFFTNNNYLDVPDASDCSNGPCSCYNTDCGFVQTSNTIALDSLFSNYSASAGVQYQARFSLHKFYTTDNWHFKYENTEVGLWFRNYFDTAGLYNNASTVDFGGEVYDFGSSATPTPLHTTTVMGGDGTFGSNAGRWQHAAFQKLLSSQDSNPNGTPNFSPVSALSEIENTWQCYDAFLTNSADVNWGRYMFHGGVGRHTSGASGNWCQYQ